MSTALLASKPPLKRSSFVSKPHNVGRFDQHRIRQQYKCRAGPPLRSLPPPLSSLSKPSHSTPVSTPSTLLRLTPTPSANGSLPARERGCHVSRAAVTSAGAGEGEEGGEKAQDLMKTLRLGSLFGMWYLFNIYFNIYNKQVLKVFPYPITLTFVQFAVGAAVVQLMWLFGVYKRPQLTKQQLLTILPLAVVHTMGNTFTNMSLGKVAVSFTHTIKAMEPFFSVILSALVLGDKPTLPVILALTPIVGGVALASATEASFNWTGFLSAMASNLTFQSRNVLSKKLLVKKDESMDNINLFSVITTLSFLLLLPVMLLTEGLKCTPQFLHSQGLNVNQVAFRAFMAGLCFHAYQQVSYMILQQVSPVTHSVGNCVKRVVVIVTSVIVFRTPVSALNAIGTGIALAGVFGYSRVKAAKAKKA